MQSSELNNTNVYNSNELDHNINDLVNEIPIGWSSTCLDQTINYYIDCNINMAQSKEDSKQ